MPRSLRASVLGLARAGTTAVVIVAGYAMFRIWQQGQTDEQGRPADAIVVLGAAHHGDTPSPVFVARLDHAIDLWLNGVAPYLLLTGGQAKGDTWAEADVARRYAEDRGVPATAILAERSGRDTAGSLRNVAAIMRAKGLRSALFVSDRTHMLRVLRVAADLGLQAHGSPTATSPSDLRPSARVASTVHELGALAVYLVAGQGGARNLQKFSRNPFHTLLSTRAAVRILARNAGVRALAFRLPPGTSPRGVSGSGGFAAARVSCGRRSSKRISSI